MLRWIILTLCLLLATPAHAITITSGSVGAWQGGDFGGAWDLHGAGYDLVTFHNGVNEPVSFAQYTTGGTFNVPRDFSHTVQQGPSGDIPVPPGFIKGSITWVVEPVTVSPTPPFTVTFASAPFSMTGVLNGTDVDGIGTFTLGAQGVGGSGWHTWSVNFTFADGAANGLAPVPEPATLFLMGTGLVAAGVAWRRRR